MISYKKGDGFLYRLNPMVKGFLVMLVILLFSFLRHGPFVLLALLLLVLFSAVLSKTALLDIFISIKQIWFLLVVAALVQGFSNAGFNYFLAFEAVLRILGIFITAGIYVSVTSQSELTFFCEGCFWPLGLIGLNARELALVMVIAVRFFPVILSEIERIRISQIARGASFKGQKLTLSARALMPLLIPTLTMAITRANELALAMEARGYCSGAKRTTYKRYSISLLDFFALLFSLLCLFFALKYFFSSASGVA